MIEKKTLLPRYEDDEDIWEHPSCLYVRVSEGGASYQNTRFRKPQREGK